MRYSCSLLLAALFPLLWPLPSVAQVEPGQTFTAKVVEVTDADTYDDSTTG